MDPIEETYRQRLALLVVTIGRGRKNHLAEKIEKAPAQVSQWINASRDSKTGRPRVLSRPTARQIEKKLDLPEGWMDQPLTSEEREQVASMGSDDLAAAVRAEPSPLRLVSNSDDGDHTIPEYDTGGKMGSGGLVLKDQPGMIRSWRVSAEWMHKNVHSFTSIKNLAIVTGFGDSMRPLYNPGDPLLVDTGVVTVDFDGVYFFRIGAEGFVKRLQRIPTDDGFVLRAKSDNDRYDPFDITKRMDFELFGRVVKVWQGTDF